MSRFLQVDEEGYFLSSGLRVVDPEHGQALIRRMFVEERGFKTASGEVTAIVEAFDEPYVALGVERGGRVVPEAALQKTFQLNLAYGTTALFELGTLVVDEWDRFHGRTLGQVPFVFSRAAQMQFFDLVDSFDDDSFTVDGVRYEARSQNDVDKSGLSDEKCDVSTAEFWSSHYQDWNATGVAPGWDLDAPAPALKDVIPQIKIPKSRIAVLGAGAAHDAAFLASLGHLVTAIDISAEAISRAQNLHPESANLKYVVADVFTWAKKYLGQFDVILEHTFFCAVDPARRQEVVSTWRQLLADGGHLLGIFYVMDRGEGPPFGASEWEIRQRLKADFEFLYWTRWKNSIPRRMGKELVVYARKK